MSAKINAIGNFVRDPEVRNVGGQSVVSFTIGVGNNRKGADGKYGTDFFACTMWGKRGETIMAKCQKGTQISVNGSFDSNTYKTKEGAEKTSLNITLDDFTLLARTKDGAATKTAASNNNSDICF